MKGNFIHSGNYRITEFQVCCSARLYDGFLSRIACGMKMRSIPQLTTGRPGRCQPHVPRDSNAVAAYFNFVFRYHQAEFKGLPTDVFARLCPPNSVVRWKLVMNRLTRAHSMHRLPSPIGID